MKCLNVIWYLVDYNLKMTRFLLWGHCVNFNGIDVSRFCVMSTFIGIIFSLSTTRSSAFTSYRHNADAKNAVHSQNAKSLESSEKSKILPGCQRNRSMWSSGKHSSWILGLDVSSRYVFYGHMHLMVIISSVLEKCNW